MKKGCCKDKTVFVKMIPEQSAQKVLVSAFPKYNKQTILLHTSCDPQHGVYSDVYSPYTYSDPPPILPGVGLYLKNQVFRI